jgi:hypothetical protein
MTLSLLNITHVSLQVHTNIFGGGRSGRRRGGRKHMTLRAQKLKTRCAHKSDATAVCVKLKTMSRLTAIYLYHSECGGVMK